MSAAPTLPDGIVRPALAHVAPYQPGRPIDDVRRELGLDHVVKLASNEGPYPPFPAALEAVARAAVEQRLYPDPGAWALRDALSARTGVAADRILVGNGVDSLIKLLCLALLDPGDALAMGWPSFISWRQGAGVQGAEVRAAPLAAGGAYDLEALAAAVTGATKLVVVVSPNNPTGGAVAAGDLARFLDALPDHVLPVLDEAYFEYLPPGGHDGAALVREGRRLVVLRTFSKAYGLAGLRVGYLLGPADLVVALGRVRNAFDVNGLAQVAAVASLEQGDALLPERMREIREERERVAAALTGAGLTPLPSTANFLLVPCGSPEAAAALADGLLRRGVIVRPTAPFGDAEAVRITIGLPEENDALLDALRAERDAR
jgi:histidinol-phosphate aminotransferase